MLNVGIIGYGYWGPNLTRNFSENQSTKVVYICDRDVRRLKIVKPKYPSVTLTANHKKILLDDNINLVAIATPVSTHFNIARESLLAGKHVLVEKPMTASVAEAEKLTELADKKNLKLFVDHTFVYTDAIKKIKSLMMTGEIGDIYYFDSVRVNLGIFQHDINVVWDLAPHDFSIMHYLIDDMPESVSAVGAGRIHHKVEDVAYVTVKFKSGLIAHFHVNWMSPVKIRKIIIGGSKKMVVFDDLSPDEKIKIYDKGIKLIDVPKDKIYRNLVQYRIGDMHAPKIENTEALKNLVSHIVDCIENNKKPLTDGLSGLSIVKLLEASDKSLKKGGSIVKLK